MADPQPTDPHLIVAHSINEAIMTRDFTKRQRKILDLILRLSWGCNKKEALIPRQRDFSVVGVYEFDIKAELDWLVVSEVIVREGQFYWFNKNFDNWAVSRVKPYQPKLLGKLLSLNLNGNYPELCKTLSYKADENDVNLVKHKDKSLQNTKFATPDSGSPKERVNKDTNTIIKKESIKKKYGEGENVLLTDEEFKKLVGKFGERGAGTRIENLSAYIASKGKNYKSHYFTILNWENMDNKESNGKSTPRKLVRQYTNPENL